MTTYLNNSMNAYDMSANKQMFLPEELESYKAPKSYHSSRYS